MVIINIVICFCVFQAVAVVANYQITEEQYYKFPRLFHLDEYDECLSQRDGVYCLGSFNLQPLDNKHLYDVIKAFSEDFFTYNRTRIHRGFCVSSRCPELKNSSNMEANFQKCVHKWTRQKNGLSAKLYQLDYCNKKKDSEKSVRNEDIDWFNIVVKCIIVFNLVGTVYDIYKTHDEGNPYLLAWSLKSNWKLLTESNNDDDKNFFQPMQFARVFAPALVILAHVILSTMRTYIHNPLYLEFIGKIYVVMLIHNGSAVAQVFTLFSNFFLGYKILKECEKYPNRHIGLRNLPKLILHRLIRILPLYWFILYFSMTWWSTIADGPMWYIVKQEAATCRQNWLPQFLMITNLVDSYDRCLPHTWSLKVDMQLYVLSAFICLILARNRHALPILITLLFGSILAVFGISYVTGLKYMMSVTTPETMRMVYSGVDTVTFMYMSPWGSAPTCFLGLVLAHIMFGLQKRTAANYKKDDDTNINEHTEIQQNLKIVPCLILMGIAWILTGHWAKNNTSHLASSVYTAVERPVLMGIGCCLIFLVLRKVDKNWYSIAAWQGWKIPSRLSFSAMLIHWLLNLSIVASNTQTTHFSIYNVIIDLIVVLFGSFVLSLPCTLMLEMPAQRFLQKLLSV